jgi:hypothetical protein
MMAAGRRSVVQIFAFPVIIALIVAFGLVSALLGNGIWDSASWIALALPLAVIIFFVWKRQV